ncbi:MarR family winged helix-turn-helix transcriptional regulator [Streptomyces sp. enrichment culture]|uniref:MarR family winged helix-turn-helix transcriptional regulator n=1 Tax=Streptomyces sp. enrichment culture TaxID=1795815 RepID=UPI003F55FCAA
MSSNFSTDAYPLSQTASWPASDIAAAWQRELPGVRAEAIEIITPLWRVAKILADDRRRTLARLGIDGATLDLLSVIRRAGPPYELTTREIARRTLITPGAVSQRVARAEEVGLVEREPSPASRRAVVVRLTDAGHALINNTVRPLLDHEADLVSVLSDDERRALTAVLAKLERVLTQGEEPSDHDEEHGQRDPSM